MQSVQRLANEALVLRDGEVVFRGPTSDAISAYHESLRDARHVTEDADGETAPSRSSRWTSTPRMANLEQRHVR